MAEENIIFTILDNPAQSSDFIRENYKDSYWVNNCKHKTIFDIVSHVDIGLGATKLIEEELSHIVKNEAPLIGAMAPFVLSPRAESCFYHYFIAKNLCDAFPKAKITCLVEGYYSFYFLKEKFKDHPYLEVKFFRKNLLELIILKIPKVFSVFGYFLFAFFKYIYLWLRPKDRQSVKIEKKEAVFLSPSESLFEKDNGDYMDYVLMQIYKEFKKKKTQVFTLDKKGAYSYLNYLNLWEFFKCFLITIKELFQILTKIEKSYFYYVFPFLNGVFMMVAIRTILKKIKPKYIFFQDEIYAQGRLLSLAVNKLNIESIGVQHAMITCAHPTYMGYMLYSKIPNLLPQKVLIYGNETERILSGYGYPIERMVKIGCKRIYDITSNEINHDEEIDVLFLSPKNLHEFDHIYKRFKGRRLAIRPHPLAYPVFIEDDILPSEFNKKYKDIPILNPKKETLESNLRKSRVVFSTSITTAFFDAILLKKTCVLLTTSSIGDYCEMAKWGVQVVTNFDQINWEKKPDSTFLAKELEPKSIFDSQKVK